MEPLIGQPEQEEHGSIGSKQFDVAEGILFAGPNELRRIDPMQWPPQGKVQKPSQERNHEISSQQNRTNKNNGQIECHFPLWLLKNDQECLPRGETRPGQGSKISALPPSHVGNVQPGFEAKAAIPCCLSIRRKSSLSGCEPIGSETRLNICRQ